MDQRFWQHTQGKHFRRTGPGRDRGALTEPTGIRRRDPWVEGGLLYRRAVLCTRDGSHLSTLSTMPHTDSPGSQIHATPMVATLSPVELRAMIDRGDRFVLYDVRTVAERRIATLPGALHLDADAESVILALDRETPLVFCCHHGIRSLSAARYFARVGFSTVYNLEGGIDAWSVVIDPSIPRY